MIKRIGTQSGTEIPRRFTEGINLCEPLCLLSGSLCNFFQEEAA